MEVIITRPVMDPPDKNSLDLDDDPPAEAMST